MRNNKLNYVAVGAFVLAMLSGLVVAVVSLSGRSGPSDTYYTTYRDATGLKFGSQVYYMGYPVGQVEKIEPVTTSDGLHFKLELSISEEFSHWKVPADSVAQIKAAGLLAAITIDIRTGTSGDVLSPGDELKGLEQSDVFGAVSDTANVIKVLTETEVKPLLSTLNTSVQTLGKVIESDAAPLLVNLNRVATQLGDRGPEIITNFL